MQMMSAEACHDLTRRFPKLLPCLNKLAVQRIYGDTARALLKKKELPELQPPLKPISLSESSQNQGAIPLYNLLPEDIAARLKVEPDKTIADRLLYQLFCKTRPLFFFK